MAQIILRFFFSVFHLPGRRNFHTDSRYDFCADLGALTFEPIFCTDFCAQIFGAQRADYCTDFCADFRRCFFDVLVLNDFSLEPLCMPVSFSWRRGFSESALSAFAK